MKKIAPPIRPQKRKALDNLQEYLLPELRVKKTKKIIQILPSTKTKSIK